ncbi:hypothetical protein LCGC14_1178680 [marine sediment metagenome]|uniref:Uncharacterized protein n=1 Tax=marine sediment metagenome TaxID=412755 RepID=A0A0F9MAL7_9ZZZZ
MKPVDKEIVIMAIACLTLLELFAMHYGINGTIRTIIFTIIAALAGLSIDAKRFVK